MCLFSCLFLQSFVGVTQAVACKSELKLCIISVTLGYKDCRPRLVCIHWGYRQRLSFVVYPCSPFQQKTLSPLTNLLSVSTEWCCAFHWQLFNNICLNSLTWKCNSNSLELLDRWCCPKLDLNKSLYQTWNLTLLYAGPCWGYSNDRTAYAKWEKVKREGGRRLRMKRVYSQMGFSAAQKPLVANLVKSLCRPPGPEAVLLRQLRGLVHQSQGSEPFTSFPRDLPAWEATSVLGFSPYLTGKLENR